MLDITSWDLCDSAADLFGRTPAHTEAIAAWARRPEPFVKRCAFSMMARRAVWAKDVPDREFLGYLPLIHEAATDERNDVKKGVSWALRQIGKRNRALHSAAIDEAEQILALGTPSARWIARDVLRELESEKTRRGGLPAPRPDGRRIQLSQVGPPSGPGTGFEAGPGCPLAARRPRVPPTSCLRQPPRASAGGTSSPDRSFIAEGTKTVLRSWVSKTRPPAEPICWRREAAGGEPDEHRAMIRRRP